MLWKVLFFRHRSVQETGRILSDGSGLLIRLCLVYGFATAFGFFIAIVLMAGVREKIEYNDIPKPFQGTAIVLLTACLMAIAFMGFSGMVSV